MAQKLVFLDSSVQDAKARIKALDTTTSGGHNWDSSDNPFYYSVVFGANGHLYTHGVDFNCIDPYNFNGQNGVPVITTSNGSTTISYRSINNSNSALSDSSTSFVTEKIIKGAIDNAVAESVASAFKYKGTYIATTRGSIVPNNFTGGLTGVKQGWAWKVTGVSGDTCYFGNVKVENGDTIIANKDNASAQADFDIIQTNIDWAGLANNTFQIQVNGTNVVTYNPTIAKTLNFVAGTNITLTQGTNSITIASTDTNTWRPFKMQNGSGTATDILGSGIDSGTLTFKAGDNMTLEYDTTNKVLTFKSSYVDTNTWRPIYAYLLNATSGSNVLTETITGANALNFGQEFAYTDADTMTGSEIHLVWAEVSSSTVTYHV